MALPDISTSPAHNRMLLEQIVQSTPANKTTPNNGEVNTMSVLDALKEISRKRIHTNEVSYQPLLRQAL